MASSKKDLNIYFHAPCFDGIASCVLAWDFLEEREGLRLKKLFPVNYDLRNTWLASRLKRPCAVVDFLYHPDAQLWADHHLTTFLSDDAEEDFESRKTNFLMYQKSSPSCALLLWTQLKESFDYRNQKYAELVKWATKIDSADYETVKEAIFGDDPALRIRAGLAQEGARELSVKLVRLLRNETLDEAAKIPEIDTAFKRVQKLTRDGLKRFKKSSEVLDDNIVIFNVDTRGVLINRYSPYHFYPNARYSLGIIRSERGTTITAMRNPWLNFHSVFLGKIFEKMGGGGHRRVGSVFFPVNRESEIDPTFLRLLQYLRQKDTKIGGRPEHDQEFQFL